MRVIIAAARTGGHINPGIAIANKIKEKEPNSEILFIGTEEGLEKDLVPRAGYQLKTIEAYGFNRKINISNIMKIIKTFHSKKTAKKILKEFAPDIVIGTGGYIAIPVILAACSLKIKTALHESNAFPGASVKFLSSKVDKILVGFEDAKKRLPKAKKVIVTGTPTKIKNLNLSETQKNIAKKQLGLKENLPTALIFGGSQGAKAINETLISILKNKSNKEYQILWATGFNQYDAIKQRLKETKIDINHLQNGKVVPYIYNMEEAMNICDIVVARSGAMTVTEIAKVRKTSYIYTITICNRKPSRI